MKQIDIKNRSIVSLFTGAGGLDLGFKMAGFKTIWANEFDKKIWEKLEYNFPDLVLEKSSILDVKSDLIPDSIGIIGGPPCQSFSEAGSRRGIDDERGKLFFEYIRVLKEKKPLFFVCENVSGILDIKNKKIFDSFISEFVNASYKVSWKLIDANDYGVPQSRQRVIIVGYRSDLNKTFVFPNPHDYKPVLKDAIYNMEEPTPTKTSVCSNNNEYLVSGFSSIYMSRNRVRSWDEPSFTIQAGGRHAPIHPNAPKMVLVGKDKRIFVEGQEEKYRRLSVRECARIQTFPDDFKFIYSNILDGYKMIGNAVPVKLAYTIANKIKEELYENN